MLNMQIWSLISQVPNQNIFHISYCSALNDCSGFIERKQEFFSILFKNEYI